MQTDYFRRNIRSIAHQMRRLATVARYKGRFVDFLARRPNLLYEFWADANRGDVPADIVVRPNFDNSPMTAPS
jgi:hypothetical protein